MPEIVSVDMAADVLELLRSLLEASLSVIVGGKVGSLLADFEQLQGRARLETFLKWRVLLPDVVVIRIQ